MAKFQDDLNSLTTKRLLFLLKKVRSCDSCLLGTCEHPSIDRIKKVLVKRENIS